MLIAVPGAAILLTLLCANFFGIFLPFELIAAVSLCAPMAGAILRLKFLRDRDRHLTPEELDSPAAKIFFAAAPAELLFSVVALMIIFGEK